MSQACISDQMHMGAKGGTAKQVRWAPPVSVDKAKISTHKGKLRKPGGGKNARF